MAATSVISIRIDPELHAALKRRARVEDSTVSRVVVGLVERAVQPSPRRSQRARSTMGMFPDFEAPDLDELTQARRQLSARLRPRDVPSKKR